MSYSPERQATVLYLPIAHKTWEWNGMAWTLRSTATVGTVDGMGYDGTGVIMTGYAMVGLFIQFRQWRWTGTSWPTYGTPPVLSVGAVMAYDSVRDRLVRVVLNDGIETYEWDHTSWSNVTHVGPSARDGHAMTFDVHRREVVLFGGLTTSGAYPPELWRYKMYGDACTQNQDCDTFFCVDGVCCEKAACGTCEQCNVPGSEGTCVPTTAVDLDTCPSGRSCVVKTPPGLPPFGECAFTNGGPCGAASDCHSGICSPDGVCCNLDCTENCRRCDLPGSVGTCSNVPLSLASTGRGGICAPYLCSGGTGCPTNCPVPDSTEYCAPGLYCTGSPGMCQTTLPVGLGCTSDAACEPGSDGARHCINGVCCATACGGTCRRCDVPGQEGVCAIPIGSDPSGDCAGELGCGGVCGASGECEYPQAGKSCQGPRCALCNAKGGCTDTPTTDDRCPVPDCTTLGDEGECWSYTAGEPHRCQELNLCATVDEQCVVTPKEDGTSCSAGSCIGGICVPPTVKPPAHGCSCGVAARGTGNTGLAALCVAAIAAALIGRRRRRTRKLAS
jgi:hypothetical protein